MSGAEKLFAKNYAQAASGLSVICKAESHCGVIAAPLGTPVSLLKLLPKERVVPAEPFAMPMLFP